MDSGFAEVLQKQKEIQTFILITTGGMMSVDNAFIAEGGLKLTGIITKKMVLTTTANTGIYKLREMWKDVKRATDLPLSELSRKHTYLSGGKLGMSSCEQKVETFPVACISEHLKICNTS